MLTLPSILKKFKTLPKPFTILYIISPTILDKPSKFLSGFADYKRPSTIICDHLKKQKIDKARTLFDKIPFPSIYLCTKMIAVYTQDYRLYEAMDLFDKMPVRDTAVWNLMIKGCFDCGNIDLGWTLFEQMPERNVISWTTMINGLLNIGMVETAEDLFRKMPLKDVAVWNAMIYGYFSNGRVEEAVKLFGVMPERNVISWTSVISGLDQHGRSDESFLFFQRMLAVGIKPTSYTFASAITASANLTDLGIGRQIHGQVVKVGYLFDEYVTAALVTLYANCKNMKDSCNVFNEKLHVNVVVWTSLLTGYGLNGKHKNALNIFGNMFRVNLLPNQSSFTSALNSCCALDAVDWGKEVHAAAVKLGLDNDVFVGNSLVEVYNKCGNIGDGVVIFKEIPHKNIVSWNSVIVGCAQHGYSNWAFLLYGQMVRTGVNADDITFIGLLSACSHSGLLGKGRNFFQYLRQHAPIEVKLEHYACMVDIFCRSGKLDEAENLVNNMPMKPNLSIWLALLSSCRTNCDVELAERAANNIFHLDPHNSAVYVLLSNIYASAGRWSDVEGIREKMKRRADAKQPGHSWVHQKTLCHPFISGEWSQPLSGMTCENWMCYDKG